MPTKSKLSVPDVANKLVKDVVHYGSQISFYKKSLFLHII
jgi:hypothetical protein